MVDIYNEVFTKLKTGLNGVCNNVLSSYPDSEVVFPCVVFSEITNVTNTPSVDSGGEKHSEISYEINIFTNSPTKETDAKHIRGFVDNIMFNNCGFTRDYSSEIKNYSDKTVYRYMLRYSGIVSTNKIVYRR